MACMSPWKESEIQEKDRHSRMPSSSKNAPEKRDGGGGRNRGSPTEVTWYDPVGIGGMTKVQVAPAVEPTIVMNGVHAPPVLKDSKDFPDVQTSAAKAVTPPRVVVMRKAPKVLVPKIAARVVPAPPKPGKDPKPTRICSITDAEWKLVLEFRKAAEEASSNQAEPDFSDELELEEITYPEAPAKVQEALRTGISYDSTRPRNAFARRPRTSSADKVDDSSPRAPALSIDWSDPGTRAFSTEMVRAASNSSAHTAGYPNANARPGLSLEQLRAAPPSAAYYPKMTKQHFNNSGVKFGKPQVVVQRKR